MPGGGDSGVTFVCGFAAGSGAFARSALNLGGDRFRAIASATIGRYSAIAEKMALTGHRRIQIDEAVAHHIKGQLGVIAQLHFFEQPGAVDTDRLHG
ncbi:hypothetical protein R69927_00390 [Paraburkholderia domus]|jgi:hypothetical protein|uniref:Uncharacterized protein n=1 Tax=Paraburkholderia domus TaxID=2793075 RepID=A0A9N8MJJ2_9BURK|nr:hypothetical protein R70006_00379 [Paraburkholderia domus]CAE6746884.1 hypothetical protein R75483_02933 [Paraburkholderia domus]CAE6783537.1 hypothetical protein R69749_01816 [Paraburkholderia domus]CAE6815273.1 hypothetical protein R69927_00390 [Paraburkholderia domus]CAE6860435.1 hypothetical protein R70211_00430 [Paraburkholderia domus]